MAVAALAAAVTMQNYGMVPGIAAGLGVVGDAAAALFLDLLEQGEVDAAIGQGDFLDIAEDVGQVSQVLLLGQGAAAGFTTG